MNVPEGELRRPYHPVANIFPLMEGEEFERFKADIAANGLHEPIWITDDGQIIDGRNRHRACLETDTPLRFRTWDGAGQLVAFVVSLNLHRRHLNESQRAVVAAKLANMDNGGDRPSPHDANFETANLQSRNGISRSTAAGLLNVSERSVHTAARVLRAAGAPLVKAVEQGVMPVSAAAPLTNTSLTFQTAVVERVLSGVRPQEAVRQAKAAVIAATPIEELPAGKYRVIYADPPWSYSNTQPDYHIEQRDHYPVMALDAICALAS